MQKHSSQFLFYLLSFTGPSLHLLRQQHHNVIASGYELSHSICIQRGMLELSQIIQLLADHFCILAVLVLRNVLYRTFSSFTSSAAS